MFLGNQKETLGGKGLISNVFKLDIFDRSFRSHKKQLLTVVEPNQVKFGQKSLESWMSF